MNHILDIVKEIKQWEKDWEAYFADRRLPQPPALEDFAAELGKKYAVCLQSDLPPNPNIFNNPLADDEVVWTQFEVTVPPNIDPTTNKLRDE